MTDVAVGPTSSAAATGFHGPSEHLTRQQMADRAAAHDDTGNGGLGTGPILMIIGGASIVAGALVGGGGGTALIIVGAVVGGTGLVLTLM